MIIYSYVKTGSVSVDRAVTGGNITYLSAHWSRGIIFVWCVRGPGVKRSGRASAVRLFLICSVADLMCVVTRVEFRHSLTEHYTHISFCLRFHHENKSSILVTVYKMF